MSKAHWIEHSHLFRADEYECSVCGAIYDKPYAVCPHCNSQMGGSNMTLIGSTKWPDMMKYSATIECEQHDSESRSSLRIKDCGFADFICFLL